MASITEGNNLVMNQGLNPLVNFNFMLRVELAFDLPCKSVRAFSRELEYDFIQEGGLNDYVHMLRKPISRPFTLEVERYVGVDYVDPMPLGADLVLPVMLFVSRFHSQFTPFQVARTYVFTGCTVMKKEYGELNAGQSGLLVETTTLGYREMLCVDIPWSGLEDPVPGAVPTKATNAATAERTPPDLKVMGQELYDKAKKAAEDAAAEYREEEMDILINELKKVQKKVQKELTDKMQKQVDKARTALEGTDGKTLQMEMEETRAAEQEADEILQKALYMYNNTHTPYAENQKKLAEVRDAIAQLDTLKSNLSGEIRNAEERKAELEKELPDGLRDMDSAKAAMEQADRELEEAREELEKARQAYRQSIEGLDGEAQKAQDYLAEIEAGEELAAEAEKTVREAAGAVYVCEQLEGLEANIKRHENAITESEEKKSELQSRMESLENEAGELKQAVDAAEADRKNAVSEHERAATAFETAQAKLETQLALLADGRKLLTLAEQRSSPTQNSISGLETRKKRAKEIQKLCREQHESCQKANDALQALADDAEAEIRAGYEEVKKLSRQTVFSERQISETVQHMKKAEELTEELKGMLEQAGVTLE